MSMRMYLIGVYEFLIVTQRIPSFSSLNRNGHHSLHILPKNKSSNGCTRMPPTLKSYAVKLIKRVKFTLTHLLISGPNTNFNNRPTFAQQPTNMMKLR